MQFVSNAELARMGFNDPSRVNVYGYGGRVISESLTTDQPDDLPMLPCVRTASGIVFFGVDHTEWLPLSDRGDVMVWRHQMQPYSENSYYFLSDRQAGNASLPVSDRRDTGDAPDISTFFERTVHEIDIFAPAETGRDLFGEDMRDGKARQFSFPLPDNVSGNASARIAAAAHITGSAGSFSVSSNGRVSSNNISIAAAGEKTYWQSSKPRISITGCGDNLQLNLAFRTSGTVKFARLDFIEVEYERLTRLSGGQIYFYLNERTDVAAKVAGCSQETQIWDVTKRHAPVQVEYTLSGSTATFLAPAGNHEYVAFNPSQITNIPTAAGQIRNQNIHAMEVPDMIIITPPEYGQAADKVADIHRELDQMVVHVLTPDILYNEFSSGNPDVSAFRKAMKMWYDRGLEQSGGSTSRMRYCLLMSRPTYDNKMVCPQTQANPYPRIPIWQSSDNATETSSYSTDDFIGMLGDTKNFIMSSAKIHVSVGRFPVRSLSEAMTAADKLDRYLRNPVTGPWRNNLMVIADDQDSAAHLLSAQEYLEQVKKTPLGDRLLVERLYLDTFPRQSTSTGYQFPLAKQRLFSKIDEGQSMIVYIGHANTISWTHEQLLTWTDINNFNNSLLPVMYAPTCEFARWDADAYSGGEVLWAYPEAGIIAGCIPSRSVYISDNGHLTRQVGKYMYAKNEDGSMPRFGDVFTRAKNEYSNSNGDYVSNGNKLRYCLIGDPAMKLPVPEFTVEATMIKETDMRDKNADMPVLQARGMPVVKGVITGHDGNILSDFNGNIHVTLLDAEKAVTSLGHSKDNDHPEPKITFNDRKTKLFNGIAKVRNGEWEITVTMPSEIENNWSPGRMSFYAVADDGREAAGATEKFYVYGFDYDAADDDQGPQILRFTLNSDSFKDGDAVANRPVVFATVSDESGINLSDTGIGHSMLLTVDDNMLLSDLSANFVPDPDTPGKGSLAYQLPELSPGKHNLMFTVWDNANNSSYASLSFNIAASKQPEIYQLYTDCNPAVTDVTFTVASDRPMARLEYTIDVFDLSGRKVWSNTETSSSAADSTISMHWNLNDSEGNRVERGIYLYRATLATPEGYVRTKTQRLAVASR